MDFPLLDETDIQILMHRDVHFGGNFHVMIEYYENEGVGVDEEFDIERLYQLQNQESSFGEDLVKNVLPSPIQEEIERAKKVYLQLRDVYEDPTSGIIPRLISDLILSEELIPEEEMQALIEKKADALSALIQLIDSSMFYDPLYPGYGRAPIFAAKALAQIGDPKAIPHLFSALGQENFEVDEALISSLKSFKEEAKTFLLKALTTFPLSKDNERAAITLAAFIPDLAVEQAALELLKKIDLTKHEILACYLICLLAETQDQTVQRELRAFCEKNALSHTLQAECHYLLKSWK